MKKILALLLTFCMLACLLSGCTVQSALYRLKKLVYPDPTTVDNFSYCLDDEMVEWFYTALDNAKTAASGEDEQAAEDAFAELDDAYMALYDQNQIAYVYYCLDLSDATRSNQYMESTQILSQAESDYNAVAKELYLAELPLHDYLFGDWDEVRIQNMLCYNDRVRQINDRTAQLTVDYRELSEENFSEDMIPIYNELVQLNNELAQIYGYDNYYEFAHSMVYDRDYTLSQLADMRALVAEYLPELCESAMDYFGAIYDSFSAKEQKTFHEFISGDYLSGDSQKVKAYIQSLPETAREDMTEMLEWNCVFTQSGNAYAGAFTLDIGGSPFCYFGPGYTDNMTVIHEVGHYYASAEATTWPIPMDLAETHSQSNEYLFTQLASSWTDSQVYEAIATFTLANDIGATLLYTLVDAFEYAVYTSENAGDMTLEQYNALMEQMMEDYGGKEMLYATVGDVQYYWKNVVVESPVYYISYAVSGLTAMDLFLQAEQDREQAVNSYCYLIEQADAQQGFIECVHQSGMNDPFSEELYQHLQTRFGK